MAYLRVTEMFSINTELEPYLISEFKDNIYYMGLTSKLKWIVHLLYFCGNYGMKASDIDMLIFNCSGDEISTVFLTLKPFIDQDLCNLHVVSAIVRSIVNGMDGYESICHQQSNKRRLDDDSSAQAKRQRL